jgi:hypothetical protein
MPYLYVKNLRFKLVDMHMHAYIDAYIRTCMHTHSWQAVDINGDGHLNYFEFAQAFQIVDTSAAGDKAVKSIIESILASLQKNQMSLGFAFRYCVLVRVRVRVFIYMCM